MQARPVALLLGLAGAVGVPFRPLWIPPTVAAYGVLLLCGPSWHSWQRKGGRDLSSGGMFEPCGVWQFRQLYVTGWCSHRKGPRFSAWQA